MTRSKYMYGQQHFLAFGLCLSQYLLCSAEFAAVLLWMSEPQGRPHPVVYLISACIVPPCACVVFAVLQNGILVLEDSSSWCFIPSTLTAGFLLQGLFLQAATLALGRQVGCSSTLGCDCSCSSWAPWAPSLHLGCGCELDIKLFIYFFGIF